MTYHILVYSSKGQLVLCLLNFYGSKNSRRDLVGKILFSIPTQVLLRLREVAEVKVQSLSSEARLTLPQACLI